MGKRIKDTLTFMRTQGWKKLAALFEQDATTREQDMEIGLNLPTPVGVHVRTEQMQNLIRASVLAWFHHDKPVTWPGKGDRNALVAQLDQNEPNQLIKWMGEMENQATAPTPVVRTTPTPTPTVPATSRLQPTPLPLQRAPQSTPTSGYVPSGGVRLPFASNPTTLPAHHPASIPATPINRNPIPAAVGPAPTRPRRLSDGPPLVTPKPSGGFDIINSVCANLRQIKITDVDFSANVTAAAKRIQVEGGKTLYQHVKEKFDGDFVLLKQASKKGKLEQVLSNAKLSKDPSTRLITLEHLGKIAAMVKNTGYAVCETIAAAVIADAKTAGFAGRLESIGIKFTSTTGHVIVVGNRAKGSKLADVSTWGDFFIVDMWYFNLGMRTQFLWSSPADRMQYHADEIKLYPLDPQADIS